VAYVSRRVIKYGGVGLILLMVGWWGLVAAVGAYQAAEDSKSLEKTVVNK
jgi:hypothetical protein